MKLLHDWWMHITTIVSLVFGWVFKDKIGDILKSLFNRFLKDPSKALEEHEKNDKIQFDGVKSDLKDLKGDILQAMSENFGILREDLKTERISTEKRFQFLEKVFLDDRLGGK